MTWELEEASSLSANLFKRKSYIKAHSHQTKVKTKATRMPSSMMRTVRSSSHLRAGGCLPMGGVWMGCLPMGGVSEWGVCPRGCLPKDVSAHGGSVQRGCLPGGLPQGGVPRGVSAWGLSTQGGYKHPPVDRMADACENITLRQYVADGKNCLWCLSFLLWSFSLSPPLSVSVNEPLYCDLPSV